MTEIKYLTHREAAQAVLDGETLMCNTGEGLQYRGIHLSADRLNTPSPYYRAPRVFAHPGGTCPAPETEAPVIGCYYWFPFFGNERNAAVSIWEDNVAVSIWEDNFYANLALSRGLVYLTREAAIARAELMLAGVAK